MTLYLLENKNLISKSWFKKVSSLIIEGKFKYATNKRLSLDKSILFKFKNKVLEIAFVLIMRPSFIKCLINSFTSPLTEKVRLF